jgi:hypothetical protein
MNPLTQFKNTAILPVLIALTLGCFALLPAARAVDPPPDGGYPGANTAEGTKSLFSLTSGIWNTALGFQALFTDTTGSFNTATGVRTLYSNTTGYWNTATGVQTLYSNTIGFWNTATGVNALVFNTSGLANTATGVQALYSNSTGSGNTATGVSALAFNTTGTQNTALGELTLYLNTTGSFNTAIGSGALCNTTGFGNTATGGNALLSNTTGSYNIGIGVGALNLNTTGNHNIALGFGAGTNVTTASNVICIGADQAGANMSNRCYIGQIRGVMTGRPDAIPVLIDSDAQLGTASSSRRFKKEIKPMDSASEAILRLKPVTFHYKSDNTNTPQFGLTAEEVAEVNPDLVVRDKSGEIYTVRYDAVNAMLLNEFLKEHRKNQEQQKQIDVLTAQLKEQAAQIQKVSAQLEASKPAPHVVNNP